jgi:hypothetical protein
MQPIEPTVAIKLVMPGLVPGIHVFTSVAARKTWMAETSPAMTERRIIFKLLGKARKRWLHFRSYSETSPPPSTSIVDLNQEKVLLHEE